MKIPVFVSCPTSLNKIQEESLKIVLTELNKLSLERRQLGKSDYPTEAPLKEVVSIMKHCAGGIILGFEQIRINSAIKKPGTSKEKEIVNSFPAPTEWNNLEAGIMFTLDLPVLVFKETGIEGGIFDHGVTDVFIHDMPTKGLSRIERKALSSIFLKWQGLVRNKYYS
ncbi:MAG: hypothetical protein PVH88_16400 [Ignavibacteria bacterium]|jgi:hypothetical protein